MTLLAIGIACWWSIRMARADAAFRHRTPEGLSQAIRLAPENGEYLASLALQAEYAGQDSVELREEIAALRPRDSAPRLRLGLNAELRGDPAQAERWLKDAFAVDHQFETRWTLANFYFRQRRLDEFWPWMKSSLEMSYGDRSAAFNLCWEASSDPAEILERAIPNRREVLAAYLSYALGHPRREALAGIADRLAALRTPDDAALLYAASDALLDDGQVGAASALWQALGNPRPDGVSHPDFEEPRVGHGFDWRSPENPGVTHLPLDASAGHRIRFSGRQPESAELLRQVIGGLHPASAYVLQWEARTEGIPSPTGLEWRIADRAGAVAAGENWSAGKLLFTPDSDHAILVLMYRRPEGQVRTDGQLDLRRVTSRTTSSPE